jgi:hypothetical protein
VVDEDAMEVDPVLGEAEVDEAAVMAALGFASFNTTKVGHTWVGVPGAGCGVDCLECEDHDTG